MCMLSSESEKKSDEASLLESKSNVLFNFILNQ